MSRCNYLCVVDALRAVCSLCHTVNKRQGQSLDPCQPNSEAHVLSQTLNLAFLLNSSREQRMQPGKSWLLPLSLFKKRKKENVIWHSGMGRIPEGHASKSRFASDSSGHEAWSSPPLQQCQRAPALHSMLSRGIFCRRSWAAEIRQSSNHGGLWI